MEHLFGQHYTYNRVGLALVGVGMGLHLASGALNQAALARDRARAAAVCWLIAAAAFLAWMLTPAVSEQLLRTEIGYAGATALLGAAAADALPPGHRAPEPRASAIRARSVGADRRARSPGRPRRDRSALEDRRAGHEHARARPPAARRGLGVDAAVDLERHLGADDRARCARSCPASAR